MQGKISFIVSIGTFAGTFYDNRNSEAFSPVALFFTLPLIIIFCACDHNTKLFTSKKYRRRLPILTIEHTLHVRSLPVTLGAPLSAKTGNFFATAKTGRPIPLAKGLAPAPAVSERILRSPVSTATLRTSPLVFMM